ncbi:hypothetical protein CKAH01_14344 [Colletotrichum kahawae]|uniref:Uncharacterized protein n=1 Tax=Colletotrichum kahawae TaxID=34407 RepID=A0AAE0D9R5_COLKA|nr:hypothetical protein CKAH01_14344 [Colletotrichum kahawae]
MCEAMTTAGPHIGYQSEDHPVVATYTDGRVMKVSLKIGNNGFVVGMTPSGLKLAPSACARGEVSDRTMGKLHSYPLNCPPDTRRTDEAKKGMIEKKKESAVAKAKTSHFGRFFKG